MTPDPAMLVNYLGSAPLAPARGSGVPPAPAAAFRRGPAPSAAPVVPFSVLVLEGEYRLTGAVLFCLSRQPGLVVRLLSRDARSPYRFSVYVRTHHVLGPEKSAAEFVAFARHVAQATRAQVLLPVDVPGMRFAIAHRAALAPVLRVLPLPNAAHYETATDKALLARFMQHHGIPAPDTIVDIRHELPAQLDGFRFPVLLKPIEGAGGRGIVRFPNREALLQAVAELPADSRYIIQHCIEGYDIDCNVLYHNGQLVAHSIQKGLMPTGGEYAPTEAIEFVRDEAVLAVADRLMRALRWSGIAHLDLRYDASDQQIKVIEVNTRFWLTVVGSAVTAGVNFPVLACLVALGRPVPAASYALGRYIPFANFLRQRFGHVARLRAHPDLRFTLRDTSLRAALGDPLTKLYRFFVDTE